MELGSTCIYFILIYINESIHNVLITAGKALSRYVQYQLV